jgi:hypothetical protein
MDKHKKPAAPKLKSSSTAHSHHKPKAPAEMTPDERRYVKDRIENEGDLHYTFRHYTTFPEIKNKEFHRLRKAYLKAAQALSDFIKLDDDEEPEEFEDIEGYDDKKEDGDE